MGKNCGLDLFQDFEFEDITRANPPDTKGVFVIRVRNAGIPPGEIMKSLESRPHQPEEEMARMKLLKRVERIRNIGDCPVLFIGSSRGRPGSRPTLKTLYRNLTRRHTAQYPIRALLSFGWELDFGWKATKNPGEAEADLKERYLNRGRRSPPALAAS